MYTPTHIIHTQAEASAVRARAWPYQRPCAEALRAECPKGAKGIPRSAGLQSTVGSNASLLTLDLFEP